MIGLESKFESYTIDTLPRSIILIGKEGSGKHLMCKYLSDKFKLSLIDISTNLSEDLIDAIYRSTQLQLYMIDLRLITDKDQNILLKLFEEPPVNAFIVLIANNTNGILPTVLNRGKIYTIPNYSKNFLINFAKENGVCIDTNYIGEIVETPGDIMYIYSNNVKIDDIKQLTNKIIDKLSIASYPNVLTIVDKINFKDEYDKININFFLKILRGNCLDSFIAGNKKAFNLFNIVNNSILKLNDSRLNKKILITNMLTAMWLEVKKNEFN